MGTTNMASLPAVVAAAAAVTKTEPSQYKI